MMSMRTNVIVLLVSAMLLACGRDASPDTVSDIEPHATEGVPVQTELSLEASASAPQSAKDAAQQPDLRSASPPVKPGAPTAQGDPCDGMDTQLTDARKREYAKLVADAMDHKVKPGKVDISMFTESGTWSMVLASLPIADPSYFFFENIDGKKTFKDGWAGVAEHDDVPGIIEWAQGLGAPESFARCFATVIPVID